MSSHNPQKSNTIFHFDSGFWDKPFDCSFLDLYQIGEICIECNGEIEEHEQSVYEITYVIAGTGTAFVDGAAIPLKQNDILVNNIGYRHRIKAGKSGVLRFAYIGFDFNGGADESDAGGVKRFYESVPFCLIENGSRIKQPFFKCINELYNKNRYWQALLSNYCQQIVMLSARESVSNDTAPPNSAFYNDNLKNPIDNAVYSIMRYVDNNVQNSCQVSDVVKAFGYSLSYLSHFFKERTGTTLKNYICLAKTEYAISLLENDADITATRIAEALNYSSLQAFSKSFKKITGVSPAEYRNQLGRKRN
ncbi:MAG: AraC family transcriptional regulator [Oscillospiraceae bacterium]|nr:AraC family transcriptional regulator [Oscillospiraceae bacterium]